MPHVMALRVALGVALASGLVRKQDTDEESLPWRSRHVVRRAEAPEDHHDRPSSHTSHEYDLLSARLNRGVASHEGSRHGLNHDHIGDFLYAHSDHLHQQEDRTQRSMFARKRRMADEKAGSRASRREHSERKGVLDPCEGSPDTCKSMCRWLKLDIHDSHSKKDGVEKCQLFEWQLGVCDYEPPERRAAGSAEDPLDCALSIMRAKVLEADVKSTVDELEACLAKVPQKEKHDCRLAADLMEKEIADFREDEVSRGRARVVQKDLDAAIAEARAALESKWRVVETMDDLSVALEDAEEVPGGYLTKSIHMARKLLEELGPIVPVVDELQDSQDEGRSALHAKDAYRAEQAILRLSSAMEDAERLEVNRPLDRAEEMEDDLLRLSAAEEDLNAAIIQANLAQSMASHMGKTLSRLQHAIDVCKEIGDLDRVPEGEETFRALLQVQAAHSSVTAAIEQGEVALSSGEGEEEAMAALRESIEAARAADLRRDVPIAADVLHELTHVKAERARQRPAEGETEEEDRQQPDEGETEEEDRQRLADDDLEEILGPRRE